MAIGLLLIACSVILQWDRLPACPWRLYIFSVLLGILAAQYLMLFPPFCLGKGVRAIGHEGSHFRPLPSRGLGRALQRIANCANHRGQIVAHRTICHPQHANLEAGQIAVAQMVVALLPAIRTAVEFHHQPRSMAVEVHDLWWERMLSSEMDSQTVATQLLPHDALLRSHMPAQFDRTPQQFRIGSLGQLQS
jgi:hypothetical protein